MQEIKILVHLILKKVGGRTLLEVLSSIFFVIFKVSYYSFRIKMQMPSQHKIFFRVLFEAFHITSRNLLLIIKMNLKAYFVMQTVCYWNKNIS